MDPTVSTSAFDAIVVREPALSVWTARGFVSDALCGLDLFVAATGLTPEESLAVPRAIRWWDMDSVEELFPLHLEADGVGVPVKVYAGASGSSWTTGADFEYCISIGFPTPRQCRELLLTVGLDMWPKPRVVALGPDVMRADLLRWGSLPVILQ